MSGLDDGQISSVQLAGLLRRGAIPLTSLSHLEIHWEVVPSSISNYFVETPLQPQSLKSSEPGPAASLSAFERSALGNVTTERVGISERRRAAQFFPSPICVSAFALSGDAQLQCLCQQRHGLGLHPRGAHALRSVSALPCGPVARWARRMWPPARRQRKRSHAQRL